MPAVLLGQWQHCSAREDEGVAAYVFESAALCSWRATAESNTC
jgi:hypothetical protein